MTGSLSVELEAKASQHTSAAFTQLYEDQAPALFNYCLYRVGDAAAAEDLVADIFERAWRARHRYDPRRGRFSTWLFAIARRRVADWQRRQSRRQMLHLDSQQPSPLPGPYILAAEAEDRHRLRQLVGALRDRDREMLALKFGAGMTNREIAQVLDKSETAIGSAVHRLVRKLRRQWEESR